MADSVVFRIPRCTSVRMSCTANAGHKQRVRVRIGVDLPELEFVSPPHTDPHDCPFGGALLWWGPNAPNGARETHTGDLRVTIGSCRDGDNHYEGSTVRTSGRVVESTDTGGDGNNYRNCRVVFDW